MINIVCQMELGAKWIVCELALGDSVRCMCRWPVAQLNLSDQLAHWFKRIFFLHIQILSNKNGCKLPYSTTS